MQKFLSDKNREVRLNSCKHFGQILGYGLGFQIYLILESPYLSDKFIRPLLYPVFDLKVDSLSHGSSILTIESKLF